MTESAATQVVDSDEDEPLLAGTEAVLLAGLDVRLVDPETGKGLFATQDFERSDLLLREPPVLVTQCFDCAARACRTCLKVLREDAQGVVQCKGGCGHEYCSEACREAAALSYHISMCSVKGRPSPLAEFEGFVKDIGNEYYLLAAMALSMAFTNLSSLEVSTDLDVFLAERATSLFGDFTQAPWWETMSSEGWDSGIAGQELSHAAEHASAFQSSIQEQTKESLEKLLRCYSIWPRGVVASERLVDVYGRLVGLMRLNCASIKLRIPPGAEGAGGWLSGIGLFATQCRLNHACRPSAALTASDHDTAAFATVRAVRRIEAGEQLSIAYVSPLLSPRSRRAELREQYLFTCRCAACEEAAQEGAEEAGGEEARGEERRGQSRAVSGGGLQGSNASSSHAAERAHAPE